MNKKESFVLYNIAQRVKNNFVPILFLIFFFYCGYNKIESGLNLCIFLSFLYSFLLLCIAFLEEREITDTISKIPLIEHKIHCLVFTATSLVAVSFGYFFLGTLMFFSNAMYSERVKRVFIGENNLDSKDISEDGDSTRQDDVADEHEYNGDKHSDGEIEVEKDEYEVPEDKDREMIEVYIPPMSKEKKDPIEVGISEIIEERKKNSKEAKYGDLP